MGAEYRPHIEITTQIGCSVQCVYCPQNKLLKAYKGQQRMSYKEFIQICNNVPRNVDIHFSGMCEPFLNSETLHMIEYASTKHRVSIFTTLTGITQEIYNNIRKLNFEYFCIHVPDAGFNTKLRATKEYCQLLQYIVDNPPKAKKFWFSMHGDYHPLIWPIIEGFEVENSMIDRAGNLDKHTVKFKHDGDVKCAISNFDQNVVLPNGQVVLCCMDYSMENVLGNLMVDRFENLNRSASYDLCKKCNRAVPV